MGSVVLSGNVRSIVPAGVSPMSPATAWGILSNSRDARIDHPLERATRARTLVDPCPATHARTRRVPSLLGLYWTGLTTASSRLLAGRCMLWGRAESFQPI